MLERLESEGFVSISPQQGAIIRDLSVHEIADQYEIRCALEGFIVRRLAGRLTPDQITSVRANLDAQRANLAVGDVERGVALDEEFHALLCRFLGNQEILRVTGQLRDKVHRVIFQAFKLNLGRMAASYEEHRAIVEAIIAGDPAPGVPSDRGALAIRQASPPLPAAYLNSRGGAHVRNARGLHRRFLSGSSAWFHADRAARGHRDHRGPDRAAPARRAGGPRGGATGPVRQQPETNRDCPAQLSRGDGQLPGRVPLSDDAGASHHLALAVPLVRAGADAPQLEQSGPLQRPELRLPGGLHADGRPVSVLAVLSGQYDGDGDLGCHLPLPQRRCPAADARLGARELRLLRGSGIGGGDATGADGTFILGPAMSLADLTDGSSTTVAASEQRLGLAGPYSQTTPAPIPSPPSRAMARVAAGPLTDSACAEAPSGWLLNKGAGWWDGNYLNTLYNHHEPPNSAQYDCITYHNPGWKAARSLHPGGVNLLFCDGHVTFAKDSADPSVWRGLSTRAGAEVISSGAY